MAFRKITNQDSREAQTDLLPSFPTTIVAYDFCEGNCCIFSIHGSDERAFFIKIFLIKSQVLFCGQNPPSSSAEVPGEKFCSKKVLECSIPLWLILGTPCILRYEDTVFLKTIRYI